MEQTQDSLECVLFFYTHRPSIVQDSDLVERLTVPLLHVIVKEKQESHLPATSISSGSCACTPSSLSIRTWVTCTPSGLIHRSLEASFTAACHSRRMLWPLPWTGRIAQWTWDSQWCPALLQYRWRGRVRTLTLRTQTRAFHCRCLCVTLCTAFSVFKKFVISAA